MVAEFINDPSWKDIINIWRQHHSYIDDMYRTHLGFQIEFLGYCSVWAARLKRDGYFVLYSEQHYIPAYLGKAPLAILTIELKPEFDYEACLVYAGWIED